jgi:hypothetical protein
MITVFVDASAAFETGAADRLRHLSEAGHALVLVGSPDHPSAMAMAWSERRDRLPVEPVPGSWYLTADPASCGDRQADLRTILIGPRGPGRPPTRCDTTARDLREAVLQVLAADAMR